MASGYKVLEIVQKPGRACGCGPQTVMKVCRLDGVELELFTEPDLCAKHKHELGKDLMVRAFLQTYTGGR